VRGRRIYRRWRGDAAFQAQQEAIMQVSYDVTVSFNGSIGAEHWLDLAKHSAAMRYKDPLDST
jgi:hypothetical protein